MGSEVERLHGKFDINKEDKSVVLFLLILMLMPLGVLYAINEDASSDLVGGLLFIGWGLFWTWAIIVLYGSILVFSSDVNEFVRAYRSDNPEKDEIEILEMAYSDALSYASDGFKGALFAWLSLGAWSFLAEIGVFSGSLVLKSPSVFWIGVGIASLLSFVAFILTILLYLRKRSIEKALFAIQLKKTDKAELSIKL